MMEEQPINVLGNTLFAIHLREVIWGTTYNHITFRYLMPVPTDTIRLEHFLSLIQVKWCKIDLARYTVMQTAFIT